MDVLRIRVLAESGTGDCFRWAYRQIQADPGSLLVHGVVTAPFSDPPHSFPHAWIEKGGLVQDWQTMVAGHGGKYEGKGYPKDVFYALWSPREVRKYDQLEAAKEALKSSGGRKKGGQHYGPWK